MRKRFDLVFVIHPCDVVVDFLMRSELVGEYYLAPRGKFGISPNLCATVGLFDDDIIGQRARL